jgi:hypothetical protein
VIAKLGQEYSVLQFVGFGKMFSCPPFDLTQAQLILYIREVKEKRMRGRWQQGDAL